MDKENMNTNAQGSAPAPAAEGESKPRQESIPSAPYYNGVPPFNARTDGSAPTGYYSPKSEGDSTPWRDPEYHAANRDSDSLYSPTGGRYGRSGYGTDACKERRGGGIWRAVALVALCAFFSAVSTGLVLWAHDAASESSAAPQLFSQSGESPADKSDGSHGDDSLPADGGSRNDRPAANTGPSLESGVFTSTTDVAVTGSELSPTQIYDMACEQVVGINLSSGSNNIFGQDSATACVGTGFVISEDGYIITCYHVVEYAIDNGYQVSVLLHDESEYPAELVGYDEDGDLAVLKINVTGMNPVTVGSSQELMVGQTIYAVGNPLGELTYTMTDGIVSALNREISTEVSASLYVFQINAAVNSGNSGGPVYDSRGMVVGIVDAKYAESGVEGLSFALPIDSAYKAAREIIAKGYVSGKAQLGISCSSASDVIQGFAMHYYGIPDGVIIMSVTQGSAADKAGLQVNDIISAVDGQSVTTPNELKSVLRDHDPGDRVTLSIYRLDTNEMLQVEVVLDEQVPEGASRQ